VCLADISLSEYEQQSHAYSSSSWYSRRPVTWPDIDDALSSYPIQGVHPSVPLDYSSAAQDAAAAAGWSLVDLKPCMTSYGLSAYTGKR